MAAIVTIVKLVCGAVVAIFLILPLLDFHIEFQPPKDEEKK